MTTSPPLVLSLDAFLKLPYIEASPAWEYLDGTAIQKPMPKTRHSLLQEPEVCRGDRPLRVLPGVDLTLTAVQVYEWLQLGQR